MCVSAEPRLHAVGGEVHCIQCFLVLLFLLHIDCGLSCSLENTDRCLFCDWLCWILLTVLTDKRTSNDVHLYFVELR